MGNNIPPVGREAIYSALFALLNGNIAGVNYYSRRISSFSQIDGTTLPALFLNEVGEQYSQWPLKAPSKVELLAQCWIYTRVELAEDIPATEINNIMDALESTIAPNSPMVPVQTLGGLVQHTWIEGRVTDYMATEQTYMSVTVVEIKMLVNN